MDNQIDYQGIPVGENQIRLIKLHPPLSACRRRPGTTRRQKRRDKTDVLVCKLETYARRSCPAYIALSYAWAPPDLTKAVYINGKICQVSETVELALRHLRSSLNVVYIWVDQLCINQADNTEKNHQVRQIRHTYTEADSTVAWLGTSFVGSHDLFTYLREVASATLKEDWKTLARLHANRKHIEALGVLFDHFCQRNYWKRLWIIQEFAIARRVTVMCGDSRLCADDLCAAYGAYPNLKEALGGLSRKQRDKFDSVLRYIRLVLYRPNRPLLNNVLTIRENYHIYTQSLVEVLGTCLAAERTKHWPIASDDRDRIFALMHLALDAKELGEDFVDYSKTCGEVYCDTAKTLINLGYIDIISYSQFPKRLDGLPTWVPDWSMQLLSPLNHMSWLTSFCASKDMKQRQNVAFNQPGFLTLQGILVDVVDECGALWGPDLAQPPHNKEAALAHVRDIQRLCRRSSRFDSYDGALDAYRIAWADIGGALSAQFDATVVKCIQARLRGSSDPLTSPNEEDVISEDASKVWVASIFHRLHSRRPFITSTGLVGLCSSHVEAGDVVCVFFGGKFPYMLRPNPGGTYTIIGDAYVDGIMYGEAMKGDPASRDFTLR